jgi:sugar/nucleoside kinase (ribokinase family)
MIPDLVTVGGLTIDNVIAADGRVALARAGGNAAYSGVGARCWVGCIGLVSLAVASYPQGMLTALSANGFDLAGVARHPAMLRYGDWFIYDAAGDRHERLRSLPEELAKAGLAKEFLTPAEVVRWTAMLQAMPEPQEPSYSQFRHDTPMTPKQVPPAYLKARGVHLAPCRIDVLEAMARHFKPSGMPITLDPGWQLAGLPLDRIAPLLGQVDAFLPSEVELKALVPGASLFDGLRAIAERCPGVVAVKRGGKGALVWDRVRSDATAVPVARTHAIDPTGAGDAWGGGFLAGLVETGDAVLAAHFGAVSAACVVSHFGADGALPVDQAACRARLQSLVDSTDTSGS